MIAIVMSGGGNRGALQAGALLELFEEGVRPDMLVGTSAGGLNAALLAVNPTMEGAQNLANIWSKAKKDDFFPGGWFSMVGRLARGRSLFSSEALRRFAEKQIPQEKRHFSDLVNIKLFITAANLNSGKLYLWGEEPGASIIDAAVASAAHPLAFPPLKYQDWQLVDGGVVANVPVGIALDKGATEIYVLNVGYAGDITDDKDDVISILNRSITLMMYQPFLTDLRLVSKQPGIKVHHISISQPHAGQMWELDKGGEMVERGRQATREYLLNPTGLGGISFAIPGATAEDEPVPPGAVEYVPRWLREP